MSEEYNIIGALVRIDDGNAICIEQVGYHCILIKKDGTKDVWERNCIYEVIKTREELLKVY